MPKRDKWADWLAERRYGGDAEARHRSSIELERWRDEVLDAACLRRGETLLDVGCGEGLVAFGALERGAGMVIFSDISADLLEECRSAAHELGVLDRCRFVQASANDLRAVRTASVDVVTTRSVLIYVADKRGAFTEFARVLHRRGRLSIFEPINRFSRRGHDTLAGYDIRPVDDVGRKLRALYDALQPQDSDAMLNFDERDLIRFARDAGFSRIRLVFEARVEPTAPRSWDAFLRTAGNPNIPTLEEAMDQALTAAERGRLTAHLRPLVEQGIGESRVATARLTATKSDATPL